MATPPISGFTFVRNAVKLDFPLLPSLRSLLLVADEVVVAVGKSDDDTLGLVRSVDDPRVRIIETEWDLSRGRAVLADQTDIAMRACRHPWGIYIQADEVLADGSAEQLRATIHGVDDDPRVEGLVVGYLHLYGGYDTIAVNRQMYRREVRAVRLDPRLGIHSFRDAQGFRVGAGERKVCGRLTDATMLHYGWARSAEAVKAKRETHAPIFQWDEQTRRDLDRQEMLPWVPGLRSFPGPHPAVAREWVAARAALAPTATGPRHWQSSWVSYYASMAVERVTGWRPFEFRNYTLV